MNVSNETYEDYNRINNNDRREFIEIDDPAEEEAFYDYIDGLLANE